MDDDHNLFDVDGMNEFVYLSVLMLGIMMPSVLLDLIN